MNSESKPEIPSPPAGYPGVLIRAVDDLDRTTQDPMRTAARDRSADVNAARSAMTIAKQLAKSDRSASLLVTAWRATDEPFEFPAIDAYRQVASDFGYRLATVVVLEEGGYAHLLFICTHPGLTGPELMNSLPAPWQISPPA